MTSSFELAPAKINLALHILGKRQDGYHLLDSLVVFLAHGDRLELKEPALEENDSGLFSLTITGRFASGLQVTEDNLVLRAARLFCRKTGMTKSAALTLHKETPIGAGLGGGSADAAAVLRLLNRIWNTNLPTETLATWGEELGADVPACVYASPVRMQGIGEIITPLPKLPSYSVVLVYPDAPLWTPDVYKAIQVEDFSGSLMESFPSGQDWIAYLEAQDNDLQRAALRLNSAVQIALTALAAQDGCLLSRMSGSGSACFALFDDPTASAKAAGKLQADYPNWWVMNTRIQSYTGN